MSRTKLAVYNSNGAASDAPTQEEINKINKEHQEIVFAARSMVPRAIKLGEWFLECKMRVQKGDWGTWLKIAFPKISYTQIRLYVEFAQHRDFLEQKFQLTAAGGGKATVDFERFTSIKEAEAAIREIKGSSSKSSKNAASSANGVKKQARKKDIEIQIEKVKDVAKGEEKANGDEMLYGDRGIEIINIEAKEGESHSERDERLKQDFKRAETNTPKEELRIKVQSFVSYMMAVEERKQEIMAWMEVAELTQEDLEYAISLACINRPEYEISATEALLEGEKVS